jgi:DNA-binding IclR family transcriptional regulator
MTELHSSDSRNAIVKALSIVDIILNAEASLTVAEIGRQLDMPRQTAHRLVDQLEQAGLLGRQINGRQYTIGPRLARLSIATLRQIWQSGPVHAVLTQLQTAVNTTCSLAIIDRDAVVYINATGTAESAALDPCQRYPLHATASGKLLAAHRTPRVRKRMAYGVRHPKLTQATITDPVALEAEFDFITKRGYALAHNEFQEGVIEVAVPVRDTGDCVVAALCAHNSDGTVSVRELEMSRDTLHEAAIQLERQIALLAVNED